MCPQVASAKGKSSTTTTKPVALATTQPGSIIGKTPPSALHGTLAWFLENNNKPEGSDVLCPPVNVAASNATPLGNALVNALRATSTANKLNMPFSLTVGARAGTAPRLAAAGNTLAAHYIPYYYTKHINLPVIGHLLSKHSVLTVSIN